MTKKSARQLDKEIAEMFRRSPRARHARKRKPKTHEKIRIDRLGDAADFASQRSARGCADTQEGRMITLLHGGQTGVDRGAHEAAIDNGWRLAGYMPSDARDELGPIPEDVARFLVPHTRSGYGARTEANVQSANAALIVARDADDPRATPGTAKTIDLAARRHLPRRIVDPAADAAQIARWIWSDLLMMRTLMLPLDGLPLTPAPMRLLVAGPRESKWPGARAETSALLRRIALALAEIRSPKQDRDLPRERR